MQRESEGSREWAMARSLLHINLVAAVAFLLGGSFFALGAVFAQLAVGSRETANITYLIGGFFFSLGGYTSILLVVNLTNVERGSTKVTRTRWWTHQPHQLGWSSAVVLFVGTLLFAVSLVAAFAAGLTPRQSNGWIWLPDILGCVCFLVSGHLAMLDVCGGHIGLRVHSLGWWVVAVNQIGSILFFLAGLAAFTRPATSRSLDIALVNWGTFAGAVCFAIGGGLQMFDKPEPARREVQCNP
ncbi:hypothetical protein EV644_117128 [Kribbella orskensis]|uniref:YrhK-like protein n=1 Tax=Kribbella orskensis TaxID=2512216 RepID=A0ABY2BCQ1_9ACTN|nr:MULTISPECIES: hypothetical protein [Kribbella]TCN35107.1 hypothetical protein EV642_118128 [Kribbella sp. VKM Ac-2500]TCO16474.1 hypothetical protein EV644_117128 [Kribbella orskensis]